MWQVAFVTWVGGVVIFTGAFLMDSIDRSEPWTVSVPASIILGLIWPVVLVYRTIRTN